MKAVQLAALLIAQSLDAGPTSPTEVKLQKELLAPCCYRETLDRHMSDVSTSMKAEIHQMVEMGASEREIIDLYKKRYGSRILAEPEGATWWLAFLIPFVALALGAIVVVRFIAGRLRPTHNAASTVWR